MLIVIVLTKSYLIASYPPPTNVRFEAWMIEKNQIVFTWDEVSDTLCSSIQYVISAVNCGVCPNATTNTNITCVYRQSDVGINNTCMFAVQTEICGYLWGEKSEYVIIYFDDDGKY